MNEPLSDNKPTYRTPIQHVKYYGDKWDGGCLTCDECDLDVGHDFGCDCGHTVEKGSSDV